MNRQHLKWIGIIGAVAAIGVILVGCRALVRRNNAVQQAEQVASNDQDAGIMSRSDSRKLTDISSRIQAAGTVSDEDLDWILHLLLGPALKDTAGNRVYLQQTVLSRLSVLRRPTPSQSTKLVSAARPLLSSRSTQTRRNGLELIYFSDDPQAKVYAKPLVNDSDKTVRRIAKAVMRRQE